MKKKETVKSAWIDDGKRIVSFERLSGAREFIAEEAAFWVQIMAWIQKGYAIQ